VVALGSTETRATLSEGSIREISRGPVVIAKFILTSKLGGPRKGLLERVLWLVQFEPGHEGPHNEMVNPNIVRL
jgi:hypothetical protein